jgi:glutaredoxin 3
LFGPIPVLYSLAESIRITFPVPAANESTGFILITFFRKLFGLAPAISTYPEGPSMANIVLYTIMFCPFCSRAKRLLEAKGVSYTEIDIGMDSSKRQEMMDLAGGGHTVPQIFIGDRHVGGSDELVALEQAGELDKWIEEAV